MDYYPGFTIQKKHLREVPEYMINSGSLSDTCRGLYHSFSGSTITLNTLAWYARGDSPDRYASWHKEWCMSSMEQALSMHHTDVARWQWDD